MMDGDKDAGMVLLSDSDGSDCGKDGKPNQFI